MSQSVLRLRAASRSSGSVERPVGRPAEQVALAGADPERADDVELGRRLDPLGDDERAPAVGEVAQGADDLERRVVARRRPGPATGRS